MNDKPIIIPKPKPKGQGDELSIRKILIASLYSLLIGFSAVGIWIKATEPEKEGPKAVHIAVDMDNLHHYEEGFEPVAVTVPIPPLTIEEEIIEHEQEVIIEEKPERNLDAPQTWQQYAASPVSVPKGHAKVILVIDDLGIVKGTSKKMIDMEVPLTLSFLPYASGISEQVNDAYDKGHDILVHIPMEPKGDADPGPHALLSKDSVDEQMQDIDYNLSQFSHYIGINNHMGSAYTEDAAAMGRLLDVIKEKGLFVLDSKTTNHSMLEQMAREKNIPVTNRDVFLDNKQDVNYIMGQLAQLEKIAKNKGTAIAIGHPYKQTVAALEKWIPTLADKGITIVPLSQSITEKFAPTRLAVKK